MENISRRFITIAAVFAMSSGMPALAQTNPERPQAQTQTQTQERIYGSQLMSATERQEYRQRMRELKTQQEREQFRDEHHAKMQERAKERGMKLPDDPPARGRGVGPRMGDGPGMGAGVRPPAGSGKGP